METTLNVGDRIFVTYANKEHPQRGDIVVFEDKLGWLNSDYLTDEGFLVKRVIAIGGDTISADENGIVYLNKLPIDEPYAEGKTTAFAEQIVPEGKFFAMGDNRENSADSRYHIQAGTQFVDTNAITGKMWLRYWPLDNLGTVK